MVKRSIRQCKICRKHQEKLYALSNMPPLPTFKGKPCRPFEIVGLDYFGPISARIKENEGTMIKQWVCIFTCLVTRNIHLEVVHDMTTASFLNSFRRFIAIRSQPKVIYLDNATQFRAANKFLNQLWNGLVVGPQVCAYFANQGITWRFIAEYSPWQGGYYRRLLGVVKSALYETIGRKILKFEEFKTLIYEISAMINFRPLTYMYNDIVSTDTRPMDFLQCGGSTGIAPVRVFNDSDYVPPQQRKEFFNFY